MPRVWVTGSVPPLGIGSPAPGLSETKRLATPVRLSCPIVAIVPWRSGVTEGLEMASSTSASPLPDRRIEPTAPTWCPPTVTRSPDTSCPASENSAWIV